LSFSVIVPACNEQAYLPATLAAIDAARSGASDHAVEVIVVDNDSTDATASVAVGHGARVVHQPLRNVGRARNTGAAVATGEWLVFIDADTLVPPELFRRIAERFADPQCIGGAVDALHGSNRLVIRLYLRFWRFVGTVAGMAQGATQFCRRDAFEKTGGYDESLWMGEDVDFFRRLRKTGRVAFLRDVQVVPSSRRFDTWPVWKILVQTNPLFILLFRRRRKTWAGWYDRLVR